MRLLLLLTLWTSSVLASPCAELLQAKRTVGRHFQELADANALIGQTDSRLNGRNLIVPNGGLCATTCGVNVLHALMRHAGLHTGYYRNLAVDAIDRMVKFVDDISGRTLNARVGLALHQLSPALMSQAREANVELKIASKGWGKEYYDGDLLAGDDEIVLAAIRWNSSFNHAIVITKIDPNLRLISFADPNYPMFVYTTNYTMTRNQEGKFTPKLEMSRFIDSETQTGLVYEVLRVGIKGPFFRNRISPDISAPFEKYVGKSVAVQTRTGSTTREVLHEIITERTAAKPFTGLRLGRKTFASETDGVLSFDQIHQIREIAPAQMRDRPQSQDSPRTMVDLLKTLRSKRARIVFESSKFSGREFLVYGFVPPSADYPYGGVDVQLVDGREFPGRGVIPSEFVYSFSVTRGTL